MNFMDRLRIGKQSSAQKAKERLQLVLIHDRAGLSPGKLEAIRDDVIEVLSRHVEIDRNAVVFSLSSDHDQQRLVADIPLSSRRARRREAG
jgi:cell division topological specificity factor